MDTGDHPSIQKLRDKMQGRETIDKICFISSFFTRKKTIGRKIGKLTVCVIF